MHILEYQFNYQPQKRFWQRKSQRDQALFESFYYEPETEEEEKSGTLYVISRSQKKNPENQEMINQIAAIIKQEYYSVDLEKPEIKFKRAVKKAGQILMGNPQIEITVLTLFPNQENKQMWQINLAQNGNNKVFLSRQKETVDVDSELKKFNNVVSVDVLRNDRIVILTKEVSDFFNSQKLLESIISSKIKDIKKIFKENRKKLLTISGIFFLVDIKPKTIKFKTFPKIRFAIPKLYIPKLTLPKLSFPKLSLKRPDISKTKIENFFLSKKMLSFIFLIIIIFVGSLIFEKERDKKIEIAQQKLEEITLKVEQVENFLIFKEEEKANLLLQEAWRESRALIDNSFLLEKEAQELKISIEEKLKNLNKIEEIENPAIDNDFDRNKFTQEITYKSNIYSLDPEKGRILKNEKTWSDSEKLINAKSIAVDGNIWILDQNNQILRFYLGNHQNTLEITIFPQIENAQKIFTSPDLSYIYILEPIKNRIIAIDKEGKIIKQFTSPKFDDLKDLYISENTIYLLNNDTVYFVVN